MRRIPRQSTLANWPEDLRIVPGKAARRSRSRRKPILTAQQCDDIWAVLVKELDLTRDPVARLAFVTAFSVDGEVRFDLEPYGQKIVFRNDAFGARLYADARWQQLWLAGVNQNIALAMKATHRYQASRIAA